MGRIEMGSLIVLGIAVISGVFAYGRLEGRVSAIEREIENPKKMMREEGDAILDQMKTGVKQQREEFDKLLVNVVVLTDATCGTLGPNWRRYEEMDGRFPLGAGQTKEPLEGKTTFKIGEKGGTYVHQLTIPEMPKHTHAYTDMYLDRRGDGSSRGDDDDTERHYTSKNQTTSESGQDKPHNNMPPYIVMNYCHKRNSP